MAEAFIVARRLDGKTRKGEATRWLDEVALHHGSDECLTFPFFRMKSGHGRLNGKMAHTYVLEKLGKPRPSKDHECCHSCGNGHLGCVNPNHLYWGTRADNMADRKTHGVLTPPPVMRGESNVNAKLTEDLVRYIRKSKAKGVQLSAELGLSQASVSAVKVGRTWAWVKD